MNKDDHMTPKTEPNPLLRAWNDRGGPHPFSTFAAGWRAAKGEDALHMEPDTMEEILRRERERPYAPVLPADPTLDERRGDYRVALVAPGMPAGADVFAAPIAAQPQPSGNAGELPPLPEPGMTSLNYDDTLHWYTAAQMREYARAALTTQASGQLSGNPGQLASGQDREEEKDPLLPAVEWLLEAIEACNISDVQGRLKIGFNRASRLVDAARKAKGEA